MSRQQDWRNLIKQPTKRVFALVFSLWLALMPTIAAAHNGGETDDAILNAVGFDQRLDAQVPPDLVLRDEAGQRVQLGDYFGEKPVILALAYYHCPNLCPLVLQGLADTLAKVNFDIGKQFTVVTVSIDPTETSAMATKAKVTYLARYGRPGAAAGWHFLTGEHAAVDQLAAAVGMHFAYDARQQQYAHAAGVMVLTPAGKIARYFYGFTFVPQDLRWGLVEAANGRIGSPVDQLLLRCYHYDPATGKYNLIIQRVMQVAGVSTVLLLGGLLVVLRRQEKKSYAISTIS